MNPGRFFLVVSPLLLAGPAADEPYHQPLVSAAELDDLAPLGVDVEFVEHLERTGLRVTEVSQGAGDALVLLPGPDLVDGTIELELAGRPRKDAAPNMRGFVGVAWGVREGDQGEWHYECFYLRPTNGRADDQVRRNHTTQYIAHPAWPWYRLRQELPERYESYVDCEAGAWTRVRIELEGGTAKLFLHGATEPALLVTERKGGDPGAGGALALWIGTGTEAWFRDVTVTPR